MEMPPPEEVSDAKREGILWDATWRYLRGEISAEQLQEIEDRYSLHIGSARLRSYRQGQEATHGDSPIR